MTNEEAARVRSGQELRVDYTSIEKSLSELWRTESAEGEHTITRAALWNVVAHSATSEDHALASQTLATVSVAVPQRSIVIRADPNATSDIAAWISANCHMVAGEKQVCSEEVAIIAGGDRVTQIPPLVQALLIPDMPVAVWWLGDLPGERHGYVATMLESSDRLIVDSRSFNSQDDLVWLKTIAEKTVTAPADLNWVRLEDWRAATAALFDPPSMRAQLDQIRRVRLVANEGSPRLFGHGVESLYFAAWLIAQTGINAKDVELSFEFQKTGGEAGKLNRIEIELGNGGRTEIERDRKRGVLMAAVNCVSLNVDNVTRVLGRDLDQLIVRQLKRPETDAVFVKALPVAIALSARI